MSKASPAPVPDGKRKSLRAAGVERDDLGGIKRSSTARRHFLEMAMRFVDDAKAILLLCKASTKVTTFTKADHDIAVACVRAEARTNETALRDLKHQLEGKPASVEVVEEFVSAWRVAIAHVAPEIDETSADYGKR
jgi:hypothetical protein